MPCGQHHRRGPGCPHVGLPQALVEEHAGGVALDQVAHGLENSGRPGLGLGVKLVVGWRRRGVVGSWRDMGGQ